MWEDIGPIIEANHIELMSNLEDEWSAQAPLGSSVIDVIDVRHSNPKRAAAIAYLMMKDSENN